MTLPHTTNTTNARRFLSLLLFLFFNVATIVLSDAATLEVYIDSGSRDKITIDVWKYDRKATCCVLPGCHVFEPFSSITGFRCKSWLDYYQPTTITDPASGTITHVTYEPPTPGRCKDEYLDTSSYVVFYYQDSDNNSITGTFTIRVDGTAGNSASITCTLNDAGNRVNCDNAILNYDEDSPDTVTVTLAMV